MTWYYAAQGQQIGPVDETAFRELVASGTMDEMKSTSSLIHVALAKPLATPDPVLTALRSLPGVNRASSSDERVSSGIGSVRRHRSEHRLAHAVHVLDLLLDLGRQKPDDLAK